MSIVLDGTRGVSASGGLYAANTFTGTYTDGIVVDYINGNGRISVGAGDGITFYNGGVANTALMTLSSAGGLTFNQSNQGIAFNNSGAIGGATLNDYETGTFTPSYQGASGGSISYNSRQGFYTKIGNMVFAWGVIAVATNTNTGGNIAVSLPFSVSSSINIGSDTFIGNIGINTTSFTAANHIAFYSVQNQAFIYDRSTTAMTGNQITNGSTFAFSIAYQANF